MSQGDSVTYWLDGLKAGDDNPIQRLWDRYFQRLVRLAGTRLPGHARRAIDEEDVALSAFQSFCDRVRKGEFPELDIGKSLEISTRTVDRKLQLIRAIWAEEAGCIPG